MLNWRRDPDYERRMNALAIRIQQTENEILRVRSDSERIERDNKRLAELNSRLDAFLRSPDSSSPTPPETDCC